MAPRVCGHDGFISGQFSNGESINLAQIALSRFPNQGGLVQLGNNRLVESRASGQSIVDAPENGTFGSLRAASLEQSNVDLADQFVKLIINQRAFQAKGQSPRNFGDRSALSCDRHHEAWRQLKTPG